MQLRPSDKALIAWVLFILATAIVTLIDGFSWLAIHVAEWHLKDWVDVLTMLGTIGAFFAVLHVASRGERRERKEKLQRARVVAAEISVRLQEATRSLSALVQMFEQTEEVDNQRQDLRTLADNLAAEEGVMYFKRDVLIDLIPLPDDAAHRVARAQDLLRFAKAGLDKRPKSIAGGSAGLVSTLHDWAYKLINEAQMELQRASIQCERAAHLDVPALPLLDPD